MNAESNIASYSDGDGTFRLEWTLLDGTVDLDFWHVMPDGTGNFVFENESGPTFATVQRFSLLARGLHKFALSAVVETNPDALPPVTVQKVVRFDITVN